MYETPGRTTCAYIRGSSITYCAGTGGHTFCGNIDLCNSLFLSGCLIAPNQTNSCISGHCIRASNFCSQNITSDTFSASVFNFQNFGDVTGSSICVTGFSGVIATNISGRNVKAQNFTVESFNIQNLNSFTGESAMFTGLLSTSGGFCMSQSTGTSNVVL